MAKTAGPPVIKLHEARHTAATLGLEAGLDAKVVSVQLGQANTLVTHDLYMKVRPEVLDQAAARVWTLVQGEPAAEGQGA
jgi:integrase